MSEISASMVKSLRDRTGAGMMACRDALRETEGDEEKAIEIIQKKGLSKVAKKAGAIAGDGLVHAYIHGAGRVGVLIEINCQTDFVARGDDFQQFVEETAMQVAAENPLFVSEDDIPENELLARTAIFRGQLEEEAKATGKEKPPRPSRRSSKASLPSGRRRPAFSTSCPSCTTKRRFVSSSRRSPRSSARKSAFVALRATSSAKESKKRNPTWRQR